MPVSVSVSVSVASALSPSLALLPGTPSASPLSASSESPSPSPLRQSRPSLCSVPSPPPTIVVHRRSRLFTRSTFSVHTLRSSAIQAELPPNSPAQTRPWASAAKPRQATRQAPIVPSPPSVNAALPMPYSASSPLITLREVIGDSSTVPGRRETEARNLAVTAVSRAVTKVATGIARSLSRSDPRPGAAATFSPKSPPSKALKPPRAPPTTYSSKSAKMAIPFDTMGCSSKYPLLQDDVEKSSPTLIGLRNNIEIASMQHKAKNVRPNGPEYSLTRESGYIRACGDKSLSSTRQSREFAATWKSTRKTIPISDGMPTLLNTTIPIPSVAQLGDTKLNFDKPLPMITENHATRGKSSKINYPISTVSPTIQRDNSKSFTLPSMKRSLSIITSKCPSIGKKSPPTVEKEQQPRILSPKTRANTWKSLRKLLPAIPAVTGIPAISNFNAPSSEVAKNEALKPDVSEYFEHSATAGRSVLQETGGITETLESLTSRMRLQHKARKSRIPVLIVRLPDAIEPGKRSSSSTSPLNSSPDILALVQHPWSSEKRTPSTAGTLIEFDEPQVGEEPYPIKIQPTIAESSTATFETPTLPTQQDDERLKKGSADQLPEHRESLLVAVSLPLTSKSRRLQMEKTTDCRMLAPMTAEPKRRSSLSFIQSSEISDFDNIHYQYEVLDDRSSVFDLHIPESFVRPISPPLNGSQSKNSKNTARSVACFWDEIFESVDAAATNKIEGEQDEEVVTLRASSGGDGTTNPGEKHTLDQTRQICIITMEKLNDDRRPLREQLFIDSLLSSAIRMYPELEELQMQRDCVSEALDSYF
ncbi:hypothetical protein HDU84_004346 [Entophlyctis sp. JEL0112]|nr:hypothetical protein HDU84_004346 [Entophlyctis sp. JEL0112]